MKNTITIIFILISLPILTFAQSETASKDWAIGLSYEPNIGFRQLKYTSFNEAIGEIRNSEEVAKIGFTMGLNIQYQFSSAIAVELGVLYANMGMKTEMQPINNTGQSGVPNNAITEYDFNSVIIPLKINYALKTGEKWNIYATAGTAFNFFMSRNTTYKTYVDEAFYAENTNIQRDGFRKMTNAVLLGVGLNYHASDNAMLTFEPIFRQYVTSIGLQPSGKEYLYAFGLNLKGFYRF
jgi:opacity protein-like surface antigen